MSIPATNVVALVALVTFTGNDGAFRHIVTRGALLELITFGFYRFWVTTDIRRHLWSHTEINGDALEYTGRGNELLVGLLIAMAILGPFLLAYFLIGLEFERFKTFASLPLYLLVITFGQFAAYRARRYRLTRTVWRGVRFWMTGSNWSYAWRSIVWGLLLAPTLGFAYPWRTAALDATSSGIRYTAICPVGSRRPAGNCGLGGRRLSAVSTPARRCRGPNPPRALLAITNSQCICGNEADSVIAVLARWYGVEAHANRGAPLRRNPRSRRKRVSVSDCVSSACGQGHAS